MARMVRKQIYIEERQDRLLKEQAEQTGMTESELIRHAITGAFDPDAEEAEVEFRIARMDAVFDRVAKQIEDAGIVLGRVDRVDGRNSGRY